MNYQRIHDELITYRKENVPEGYTENHHIVLKSLGGSDDETNLVRLTAREHYIVHLLLAKFNRCSQTAYALWRMQGRNKHHAKNESFKSSRLYEWARKQFSLRHSERIISQETRNKMSKAQTGKTHSSETKEKIRKIVTGNLVSESTRRKMSISHTGKTMSDEAKLNMSIAQKGKKKSESYLKNRIGQKRSEESKLRMKEAQLKRYKSKQTIT